MIKSFCFFFLISITQTSQAVLTKKNKAHKKKIRILEHRKKKDKEKRKILYYPLHVIKNPDSISTVKLIKSICASKPFFKFASNRERTLESLRSKKEFSTSNFQKEASFFYEHLCMLNSKKMQNIPLLIKIKSFVSYYTKVLRKYWEIEKGPLRNDFGLDFSLDITLEIIKHGEDFGQAYELVRFIRKISQKNVQDRLKEGERYMITVYNAAFFYIDEQFKK